MQRAIRFSPDAYADGTKVIPHNLLITGNVISGITSTNTSLPAISIVNGSVEGLTVTNNKMSRIGNGKGIAYTNSCAKVNITGNSLDDNTYAGYRQ